MHDGVALEERGIPAAVIVTEPFVHEARMQRSALGMGSLEPAVIDHPLSTLSDEEISFRACQAAAQVKKVLMGSR